MRQADGGKATCFTPGDLTDGWKQSRKSAATANGEKSAEAVVRGCHDAGGRAEPDEVEVNEVYRT